MEHHDVMIDERELARRLGCSRVCLQGWRARGQGPRFLRLGRLIRYRVADVEAWLAASAVGG